MREVWEAAEVLLTAARDAWGGLPELWRIVILSALAASALLGAALGVLARRRSLGRPSQPSGGTPAYAVVSSATPSPPAAAGSSHAGVAEALRRIEACRVSRADELDLGGLQLSSLEEVLQPLCALYWLKRLHLGPSAEARVSPQLAFINGEKNEKVATRSACCPALYSTR